MLAEICIIFLYVTCMVSAKDCNKNEDCDMEGSKCLNGSCVCPPTFIANSLNTKCLPVTQGYGSSCEDNVQCSHSLEGGGICENNTCICTKGYHYFLGRCWKSSGLQESCKHSEDCFVSNDFEASICSEKKVCMCSPNYYQREYSSCRRESYHVGDPCGIYLDCKFPNAVCSLERKCEIKSALISYTSIYKFLNEIYPQFSFSNTKSKVGDNCKTNADCPSNAECNESQKCSCLRGYYKDGKGSCFPELGAKCNTDIECLGKNTQCRNSTVCVCKEGFVTSYDGRYCDKMSRNIGWSCLRDEQCGFFGPNSICLKKKCQCNEKSYFVEDQLYCWVKKSVEESCIKNEDCGGAKSVNCVDKKCKCVTGTHPSSDKTTCREDSTKVGESCVENLDCVFNNSICNKKTKQCDCLTGYFHRDGHCLQGVGAPCKNTSECEGDGSSCLKGKCECKSNFTSSIDFSKCLPVVTNLNDPCSESSQCSKIEGECVNGHCSCFNGSHFIEGWQCFITRKVNDPCTFLGNCSTIENAHCYKGTCMCRIGYQSNQKGTHCSGGAKIFNWFSMIALLTISYIIHESFDY